MNEVTGRLRLPMLVVGQGQKEITHNEALVALDSLIGASVESRTLAAAPAEPVVGESWLIPFNASGVWADRGGAIATYTQGGWRYLELPDGFLLWVISERVTLRKEAAIWMESGLPRGQMPSVSEPSGGTVVDLEARLAIQQLLGQLRTIRLMAE